MDPLLNSRPGPFLDLLARARDEDHSVLYRACADCREHHSGWCIAVLFDADDLCPVGKIVGPVAP